MRFPGLLSLFLLLAGPLEGFSASHSGSLRLARRHESLAHNFSERAPGLAYRLHVNYSGADFLDSKQWSFFSDKDPTNGNVNYQKREAAQRKRLAYVNPEDQAFHMAVDDFSDVPVGGHRDSVRINTVEKYDGGLFIADFKKMPHGCSVWPAWWSVGPGWPRGGEIDVLEGVHDMPTNRYTVHFGGQCSFSSGGLRVNGKPEFDTCNVKGCGFSDSDSRSYGTPFNSIGGGVYAHLWNREGIRLWHFSRGEIPGNIASGAPDPTTWGPPAAFFSSRSCNMAEHFYDHTLVLDTTICGDWGRPSYAGSGCPGTCDQAVANKENFKYARWMVNYIAVYQPR